MRDIKYYEEKVTELEKDHKIGTQNNINRITELATENHEQLCEIETLRTALEELLNSDFIKKHDWKDPMKTLIKNGQEALNGKEECPYCHQKTFHKLSCENKNGKATVKEEECGCRNIPEGKLICLQCAIKEG